MNVADRIHGVDRPVPAQRNVIDALPSLEGKICRHDPQVRLKGLLECQSKRPRCPASLTNSLVEIPHHNQTPRFHPPENLAQTRQVLLMVLPPPPPLRPPPSLGPRSGPRNADPNNRHLAHRRLRNARNKPSRRHRVHPQVIDLLPRFPRPEQHLTPVLLYPVPIVLPRANRISTPSKQLVMRLGQTDDLRLTSINTAQDFRRSPRPRRSILNIPVDNAQ